MRRFLMLTAIAATTLGTGIGLSHPAMAEPRADVPRPECRAEPRKCPPRDDNRSKHGKRPHTDDKAHHRDADQPHDRDRGHDRDARRAPPPSDRGGYRDGDHDGGPRAAHHDPRRPDGHPRDPRQHHALKRGDSARDGRVFRPARDSRLRPVPRGQEYRVFHDQLVLVDHKSKRILSVLGPLRFDR